MSSTNTNDYRDSTGAFKYAKNENLLWPLQNVLRHLSLSRTAWLAGVKSGKFPQPIRLSTRRVAWRSSEIIALIDKLGATDYYRPSHMHKDAQTSAPKTPKLHAVG